MLLFEALPPISVPDLTLPVLSSTVQFMYAYLYISTHMIIVLEDNIGFDVWLTVHRSSMWIKRPTRCHFWY